MRQYVNGALEEARRQAMRYLEGENPGKGTATAEFLRWKHASQAEGIVGAQCGRDVGRVPGEPFREVVGQIL